MAAHLVAPRPVRLGTGTNLDLPFFLSNALSAPVAATSAGPVGSASASPPDPANSQPSITHLTPQTNQDDEMAIEVLAANIRLDDEPLSARSGAPGPSGTFDSASDKLVSPSVTRWMAEDASIAPPRSPEAAALDEFLSILKPVIRAPSSPIARSKRLVPRSRHGHHHHSLAVGSSSATCDRHHPYARSAKSSSPQGDGLEGTVSLVSANKRGNGRSSAAPYSRRRSSNANDSSHSCGSTSISSSRSQSISRRGSDGSLNYFNAWRANSPASTMAMDINTSIEQFNHDSGVASLLLLSGMSPHNSSPDPQ